MKAAALDRRIQVRRATLTQGPFDTVETWADYGLPCWASYQPVSDAERFRAGAVEATLTARFRVRYSSFSAGLTAKDRLTFEGREHEIVGTKEIGRREFIEISTRVRADG